MSGVDRYTDAIAHIRDIRPRTEAENIALAQVHATLALAAATVLPKVMPDRPRSNEARDWRRITAPDDVRHGPVYTDAEWRFVLLEDAPVLPFKTGTAGAVQVGADVVAGEPRIDLGTSHGGASLNVDNAEALALALLRWVYEQRKFAIQNPHVDTSVGGAS